MNRVNMNNLPAVICVVVRWTRFLGVAQRTYEVCISPRNCDCLEVAPKEAKALIAERGLVKVQDTHDGCIYDTPDKDFFNKYQGWYRIHKE